MVDGLPPEEEMLLLATRCFGRNTPFPHRLMEKVLARVSDMPYEQVIVDLLEQKLIRKEGKRAFDLTSDGLHVRSLFPSPVPASIWDAALSIIKDVVIETIAHKEWESVELLVIHTAAIANAFYSRAPRLYLELMSLSVFCLNQLGRSGDAELKQQQMQSVIDLLLKNSDQ